MGMLGELPGLNARWSSKVMNKGTGEMMAIDIGIGINSGEALVGNTGSLQRLKYGPIGETVNLASRVEGATKALGVPVLITGNTFETIRESLATRRLAKVRLVGIESPVDLYELRGESASPEWGSRRDTYEHALKHFEARELTGPEGEPLPPYGTTVVDACVPSTQYTCS